ncbi:hypothetical protein K7432_004817 [Basidiobolus ranarum]|uniref:Uncharacterized protein n=1 Tax=Basidiobolus ranarum TaxID=34480 RepID=A0ABR2WXQ1_9FUNG
MNSPIGISRPIYRIPPGFEELYSDSNLPTPRSNSTTGSQCINLFDSSSYFEHKHPEVNFRGRLITSEEASYHRALAQRFSYFVQKYSPIL